MESDQRPPSANESGESDAGEEENTGAGEEIGYAVAELLASPEARQAIKTWAEGPTKNRPADLAYARFQLWLSLFFGLIIFAGIGLLGWLKVISGEVTAGLLGSRIGYWYGRRETGEVRYR